MRKLILIVFLFASTAFCAGIDSTIIKLDQKIQAIKAQQEQLKEQFKAQFNQMEGAVMALEAVKREISETKTKGTKK